MSNRRRNRNKKIENLSITQMASKGKGLGRHNGMVIFVENAVTGDVVDVLLTKKRKDYAEGRVLEIKTPSTLRIKPFCKHFAYCGGCKWQYLSYEQQLKFKKFMVLDAFKRIGKTNIPELLPIAGSAQTQYYRNKMDFAFSNRRWLTPEEVEQKQNFEHRNALGLHVPGKFDRIVDIEHCFLQGDSSNEIRNAIRQFVLEKKWSFYDLNEQRGFLRNLIIRNTSAGELMVILSFAEKKEADIKALMDFLLENFPQITSLHYVINQKRNDTIFDQDIITYHGRGYIFEQLEDIRYKISPKSFFQTNSRQAIKLYQIVREFAALQTEDVVYDLYTGTGSIALFLAKYCQKNYRN